MKSNIEILSEIFEPTSFDCKTEMEDLQIAITLNPDLKKILRAMELAQEQVKLCNIPHVMPSLPLEQLYECERCKNFYEPDESEICPVCGNGA